MPDGGEGAATDQRLGRERNSGSRTSRQVELYHVDLGHLIQVVTRDYQLRIPGPTPLPSRVVTAGSAPMINPRGPAFAALLEECVAGVQSVLGTRNRVLLFGASGTGGLEATIANLLSPGESALFCTNGWFGELWASLAEAFGVNVLRVSAPWGEAIDPSEVASGLAGAPSVSKVFATHNETSTGVVNDIAAIASVVKRAGCLFAVDSVSGVPGHYLPADKLGIDVVVTGSQKGWLAPPGLTMVAVSEAALAASQESRCPSWYFDFCRQAASQDRGFLHTTPPLSIMYSLREGIAILHEEGLSALHRRHQRLAQMTRRGLGDVGLEVVACERSASNTVTAVHSPYSSAQQLSHYLTRLRVEHGLELAAGLGSMEGKVFRVGHLGAIVERDVVLLIESIRAGLARPGCQRRRVTRTRAARRRLRAGHVT
jgi:aspartate aminotransferase-like enzyme